MRWTVSDTGNEPTLCRWLRARWPRKIGDTLQPQVTLQVGWPPDAGTDGGVARLGVAMTPDEADQLADQLCGGLKSFGRVAVDGEERSSGRR